MELKKKTIAIVFVVVVLIIVELEVWPRYADNEEQPLIRYNSGVRSSWYAWVEKLDDFLKAYRKWGIASSETHGAENRVACNSSSSSPGEKQVCDVPVDDFHPCTPNNQYNYEEAAPCVFLKLNTILDWKPQTYNSTVNLPANMPKDLKRHIRWIDPLLAENTVWVSCEGEGPADVENIVQLQYIPHRGFPAYYYPFTNKEGYLSPLVAVLFEVPRKGVLINVQCKAWAKNIDFENGGSVHFQLMVD